MKHLIVLALLLLMVCPSLAQDVTVEPEPVATVEQAPVTIVNAGEGGDVIVNQPAPTETPQSNDLSARDLLFGLIAVIVSMLLYRSVPAEQMDKLWKKAETEAQKTPATWDDDAVALGKMLKEFLESRRVEKEIYPVHAQNGITTYSDGSTSAANLGSFNATAPHYGAPPPADSPVTNTPV